MHVFQFATAVPTPCSLITSHSMFPVWLLKHHGCSPPMLTEAKEGHPHIHMFSSPSSSNTLVSTGVSPSNSNNRSRGSGLEGANSRPIGHIWPTNRFDLYSVQNKFEQANIYNIRGLHIKTNI